MPGVEGRPFRTLATVSVFPLRFPGLPPWAEVARAFGTQKLPGLLTEKGTLIASYSLLLLLRA
jgi:hypothetical protein